MENPSYPSPESPKQSGDNAHEFFVSHADGSREPISWPRRPVRRANPDFSFAPLDTVCVRDIKPEQPVTLWQKIVSRVRGLFIDPVLEARRTPAPSSSAWTMSAKPLLNP